jgi:hypothetical protein
MRKFSIAYAVVVLGAAVLAACDRPANSGPPQTFGFVPTAAAGTATAQIQPAVLPVIPTPIASCQAAALSTSFILVVTAPATGLAVDQITLQVVGANQASLVTTLLPTGSLVGLFGTTSVPAGTSRTFTFTPQLGCISGTPISMTATLFLTDGKGLANQMTVTAPFTH